MAQEEKQSKGTNLWDFLIQLLNCVMNLLKIEKIACLVIVYLIIRDGIILSKIKKDVDISKYLIDTKVISQILGNDNLLIAVMAAMVIALVVVLIFTYACVIPIYKKEINRLTDIRSELMHKEEASKLKVHNSSLNIEREEEWICLVQ